MGWFRVTKMGRRLREAGGRYDGTRSPSSRYYLKSSHSTSTSRKAGKVSEARFGACTALARFI